METRDKYKSANEAEALRQFVAGEPVDMGWFRFQLFPGSSHTEVHFYRQATERLIQAGFDVLREPATGRAVRRLHPGPSNRLLHCLGGEDRGIECVTLDYDALRDADDPALRLF